MERRIVKPYIQSFIITSRQSVVAKFESGGRKNANRKCEIIANLRTTNTKSVNLDKGKCELIPNFSAIVLTSLPFLSLSLSLSLSKLTQTHNIPLLVQYWQTTHMQIRPHSNTRKLTYTHTHRSGRIQTNTLTKRSPFTFDSGLHGLFKFGSKKKNNVICFCICDFRRNECLSQRGRASELDCSGSGQIRRNRVVQSGLVPWYKRGKTECASLCI